LGAPYALLKLSSPPSIGRDRKGFSLEFRGFKRVRLIDKNGEEKVIGVAYSLLTVGVLWSKIYLAGVK
jgi:hypothetical protein